VLILSFWLKSLNDGNEEDKETEEETVKDDTEKEECFMIAMQFENMPTQGNGIAYVKKVPSLVSYSESQKIEYRDCFHVLSLGK